MTKNIHAVELGRLGGIAQAKVLSPERRREICSKAGKAGAAARWKNHKKKGLTVA